MFNAEIPSRAELPSNARLIRSTVGAAIAAAIILVTVVLPAEYAIDPTGIGRALQLTQMGEIKKQLAIEAEADRLRDRPQPAPTPDRRSGLIRFIAGLAVSPALAHADHDEDAAPKATPRERSSQTAQQTTAPSTAEKTDEITITLKPNEGVEYKLTMVRGAVVQYSWRTDGGGINYDLHGSPKDGGKESSYKRGRDTASDSGTLTAAFDGVHGWFWRNRGKSEVVVTLRTSGAYSELKRMH